MIVYNYDADLEVSDTCVRSSLLSWVELSCSEHPMYFLFCPSTISVIWLVLWQTKAGQPRYFPSMVDRKDLLSTNFHPPEPTMSYCHTTYRPGGLTNASGTIFRLFRAAIFSELIGKSALFMSVWLQLEQNTIIWPTCVAFRNSDYRLLVTVLSHSMNCC